VAHFGRDGLTQPDYVNAAVKQPQEQRPEALGFLVWSDVRISLQIKPQKTDKIT
jgi:hypothetical protein